MKKLGVLAIILCMDVVAFADLSITGVTARQRYPWNGKVDIAVTFTGASNDVMAATCTFVATNSATFVALPVTTSSPSEGCSSNGTSWTRRFVWDASADVGAVKIDDVALTVDVTVGVKELGGVQLWENGPYWAECNVGATKPEEYGCYFWWGDTVGYKRNANNDGWVSVKDETSFEFNASNCPTCGKDNSQLQSLGHIDSTGNLVAAHDAATQHLGAPWRMPTDAEFSALRSNCDTTWTTKNGVYGRLITGRGAYASKSIFLPAAGCGEGSGLYGTGSDGLYWSSTPRSDNYYGAWYLFFYSGLIYRNYSYRYYGRPVRPLREFAILDGMTTHLSLDCQTGTRTASKTETICFSPKWEDDAEGAIVTVSVNGVAVTNATEEGVFVWTPEQNGTYTFTHTVSTNGVQIGEVMTTTFVVESFLSITKITAQQRYPWNGKVDIVVTITGDVGQVANYDCAFVATNCATQAAIPITSISKIGSDLISGDVCTRRYLWNASNDVGAVEIDDVALTVDVQKKLGGVQLWEGGPYWGECNVGASKPEEYGYYFWWGDTVGYKRNANNDGWVSVNDETSFVFYSSNCPTDDKSNSQLQSLGYIDSTGNLVAVHDAATAHLGALWRMPTDAEFSELVSNCDTTWTTKNGVYGRLITGRGAYASKSIFLPAAGYGDGSILNVAGSLGCYWSSTPVSSASIFAWYISFNSNYITRETYCRYLGQSVRPLREIAILDGMTTHLSLDCQTEPRTTSKTEQIRFSPAWESDAEGAVATVSVNGVVVTNATEDGVFEWTPKYDGTYTFTHTVSTNGVAVADPLTATFIAEGFSPKKPVFYYASGTIFSVASLSVSISCESEDATIHFTTNGTTPTLESPVYKRFKIYGKTTVKAIAFYEDGTPSEMAVAEYARGICEDPVITPADGTTFLHKDQEVSITMGEEGTLRYTLDGSEPTTNSAIYAGPFTISESTVIKAKVFSDSFFDSQVVTANLTREWEQVATPIITAASSFTGSKTKVSIACATEGVTIRYTTNGTDPNSHAAKYTGPFEVTASCTVKAYAVLDDWTNSEIASWSIEKIWGIGDALNMPDGKFTTSGDSGWVRDTEVSHDGVESMRSGPITHNQKSILSGSVTGAGTLTFWWKASCEQDDEFEWDHVEFVSDGVTNKLNGITDWQQVTCTFTSAGEHVLTWVYIKDDVEGAGDDCAWVDELAWTPKSVDPIPDLGENPTDAQVSTVISGSTDTRLSQYVTNGVEYVAYRAWATNVQQMAGGLAGTKAVHDSPHAWLSYALDSAVLVTNAPVQGEMRIAAFEKNATTGKFDFLVAVDGMSVGAKAVPEKLATLFTVEGCGTVDGEYLTANVSFEFGTPSDGKVLISAKPNDENATQFFIKVQMAP